MLTRLAVRRFKSLADATVAMPRLAVFFGPNAAGKSNLLDAMQALSWIGNARTLFDVLGGPFPVRGLPYEAFSFPPGGMPELLRKDSASFSLEADLATEDGRYRYRVNPKIDIRSGRLSIADEYLARLNSAGQPIWTPAIERVGSKLHIRRKTSRGQPRKEDIGLNHSVLSDRSLSGIGFHWLDRVRAELADWRTYNFEPLLLMRGQQSPANVSDVGTHGEYLAPFLYRLKAEHPEHFAAVFRALRSMVPSVEKLLVKIDDYQGTLSLLIRQSGVDYSSRVLSEGTLRILALSATAYNPWGGTLVALEEPENGVHPGQLDLMAHLLLSLADQPRRQVVVTTHSPLFVDAVLRAGGVPPKVRLLNVRRESTGLTVIDPFDDIASREKREQINRLLGTPGDEATFSNLLLRGFIDE